MNPPIIRARNASVASALHNRKRVGALIALVLVVAGSIGGGWFIISPLSARYAEIKKRTLPELQFRQERLDGFVSRAKQIDEQFRRVRPSDRATLEEALPAAFNVSDIIANMEAMTRLSGLTPQSVSVAVAPATAPGDDANAQVRLPPGVAAASVTLKVTGVNYLTLKEFLNKIETNSRILDLPEFSFDPVNDGMQVNLVTYAYKAP